MILNSQGGAITLGHPLGASGARLVGTVAHQLARCGSGTGIATPCIGLGQGLALVLEHSHPLAEQIVVGPRP